MLLKNIPNSRLEGTNHTLFQTKMVEIYTLFQTKTAKKKPFGAAHTYTAYTSSNHRLMSAFEFS